MGRAIVIYLKAVLLMSCIVLSVAAARFIETARLTVASLPVIADTRISAVQKDVIGQVSGARADLMGQVSGLRSDIRGIARLADSRTGQGLAIVNSASATLNGTLAEALRPAKETAQQIDDAAPLWLDCQYNPDCAFNRYQGLTKAAETTAKVIAAEAPKMTASVDSIAVSSAGIALSADTTGREVAKAAQKFNAPQTKLQQIRTWLLAIARICGAL